MEKTLTGSFLLNRPSDGALKVLETIKANGYDAYLVGGCVRDSLMGVKPNDEDITTNARPEEIQKIFSKFNVILTGLKHGTVTVVIPHEGEFEVTTYRVDGKSDDHRHPDEVAFTYDLLEDLARRDLTINAIAYDPFENTIIDPYKGQEDILNGIIRMVGNPNERIEEDALRMIRAIRFSSQKEMKLTQDLIDAIKIHSEEIKFVSAERIYSELVKILKSPKPAEGINLLHETGLLKYISKELDDQYYVSQNNPWHLYDVGHHVEEVIRNTPQDKITRMAALFHDVGKTVTKTTDENGIDHFYHHALYSEKIAVKIMRKLRFTADEIKRVSVLVKLHDERFIPTLKNIRKFLFKNQDMSKQDILRLIDLQYADQLGQNPVMHNGIEAIESWKTNVIKILEEVTSGPYRISDLAINGNDIRSINISKRGEKIILSGIDFKVAQNYLLRYVLNNPDKNTKDALCSFVRSNLKAIKLEGDSLKNYRKLKNN